MNFEEFLNEVEDAKEQLKNENASDIIVTYYRSKYTDIISFIKGDRVVYYFKMEERQWKTTMQFLVA